MRVTRRTDCQSQRLLPSSVGAGQKSNARTAKGGDPGGDLVSALGVAEREARHYPAKALTLEL